MRDLTAAIWRESMRWMFLGRDWREHLPFGPFTVEPMPVCVFDVEGPPPR